MSETNPARPVFDSAPIPRISYAQNGEDIVLWRALGHIERGFYIDVGAFDPTEHSVTRLFYDRGWNGVNVEPSREYHQRCVEQRPRDLNLNVALGNRSGIIAFRNVLGTGLSTAIAANAEASAARGFKVETRSVPALTLVELCEGLPERDIHFLKIDVEGAEQDVLRGGDFRRFRPWIVVVEATIPGTSERVDATWESLLTQAGYISALFDGLNRYFVAEEHRELLPAASVPANILDEFETITDVTLRQELAASHQAHQHLSTELMDVRRERDAAHAQAEAAHAQAGAARAALEERARAIAATETHAARLATKLAMAETERAGAETARVAAENARAAAETERAAAETARATQEAQVSTLTAQLAAAEAERARLAAIQAQTEQRATAEREGREALEAAVRELEGHREPVPVLVGAPPPPRYPVLRRALRMGYGIVRPAVRPVMHRVRNFMTAPQAQAIATVRDDLARVQALAAASRVVAIPPAPPAPPPEIRVVAAPADLEEMRRLAAEVEKAVLTLAVDPLWVGAGPAGPAQLRGPSVEKACQKT